MKPKILLIENMHEKARDILKDTFELCHYIKNDYEFFVGAYVQLIKCTLSGFNFVACPCTGTDHLIIDKRTKLIKLDDKDWLYKNVFAVAEHTFALILALVKRIPQNIKYKRRFEPSIELHGKTLGIIGYGRVGKQVQQMAEGFGMNILFHDVNTCMSLDTLLSESDIISIHVDLNESTKNLISYKEFELIKPNSYLINTSRRDIINGQALYSNIDKLAGFASDFNYDINYNENVIITHHVGGFTKESREKTDIYIANKILEYWGSL